MFILCYVRNLPKERDAAHSLHNNCIPTCSLVALRPYKNGPKSMGPENFITLPLDPPFTGRCFFSGGAH